MSLSDAEIEQEIRQKGLNAPRVTPDMVANSIAFVTYTILPSGRTTICEVTMQNGFTVRGESSCVDIRNFDKTLGEKIALDDAKNKIWSLLAYALRQKLHDETGA